MHGVLPAGEDDRYLTTYVHDEKKGASVAYSTDHVVAAPFTQHAASEGFIWISCYLLLI